MLNALKNTFTKRVVYFTVTTLFVFPESHALNKYIVQKSLTEIKANKNYTFLEKHTTNIKKINVRGSIVLQEEVIDLLNKYIDREFSSKLEAELISQINKLYNRKGYILSHVHDIKFKDSTLTAEIFEGSFRHIIINDEKLSTNTLLKQYINKIKTAPHPFRNTSEMERTFALIKRLPGFNEYQYILDFKPVNRKEINQNPPKTADLVIIGEYHEFDGIATINNRHKTSYKQQMQQSNQRNLEYNGSSINTDLIIDYNNPLNTGDKATLSTSYDGKGDLLSLATSYIYPLNTLGTTIGVTPYTSYSSTYNGTRGTGIMLNLAHPLYLTRTKSLDTNFSIETYKENFKDFGQAQDINSDITKIGIGSKFTHKINKQSKYYIGSEIQKSLHAITTTIPNLKKRDFTKLVLSAGIEVPIKSLTLSIDTQGQISSKKTPLMEQMQIGQEKGGRGFRSGEIKGNNAAMASLELSQNIPFLHSFFLGRRTYGFLDTGYANNTLFKTKSTLSSIGIGNDLFLRDNIVITLEVVKPLVTDTKFNESSKDRSDKQLKFFGEISYLFNF
ncbi:MAG: ShlB/FhaC/HecB family hemolysin secretion/activation protein [Rickettsiales bacterium]|nr:ShlB/FhaC/HecB family hemolysin secretion/activation protein [Rickettsiales bacterium]